MRVRAQAPRNRSLRYSSSVAFRRLSPPTQGGGGHVALGYRFACAGKPEGGRERERENCVSVKSGPPIDSEQLRADRLTPSFAYVHPYQPVFLCLRLSLSTFSFRFSSSSVLTRYASSSKTLSPRRVWLGPRVFSHRIRPSLLHLYGER